MGLSCSRLYRRIVPRNSRYKSDGASEEIARSIPSPFPAIHSDAVIGVSTAGGPFQLLSCSDDKTIVLYDWKSGLVLQRWTGHERPVNKVTYGSKIGAVFSASRDMTLKMWRQGHSDALHTYSAHTFTVSCLSLHEDNTRLCSGSRDLSVRIWDVETARCVTYGKIVANLVTGVKWIPGEDSVLQTGEDLVLRVWDTRSMKVAQALSGMMIYIPMCCDVSHDGTYFLTSSQGFDSDGCDAKLWDRRMEKVVREFTGHTQSNNACCFLPPADARPLWFATGSADQTIRIWDANKDTDEQCVASVRVPASNRIMCVAAASPDSNALLFSGCFNESVHVWQLNSERLECLHRTAGAASDQENDGTDHPFL